MKKFLLFLIPAFMLLSLVARADIVLDSLWSMNFDTTQALVAKFTPNNQYIVVAHGHYDGPYEHIGVVVKPWLINRATGQKVREFTGLNSNSVVSIDISPDGTYLAAGGRTNDSSRAVCLWNISTGSLERTLLANDSNLLHYSFVNEIIFSRDGRYLFITIDSLGERYFEDASGQGHLYTPSIMAVLNAQTWQTVRYYRQNTAGLVMSPTNRYYAVNGPHAIDIRDIDNDSLIYRVNNRSSGYEVVDFSPDSTTLAISEGDKIYFYSTSNWALVDSFATNVYSVYPISYFPNSRYLIMRSTEYVRYWRKIIDLSNKQVVYTDTYGGVQTISNDGKYLIDRGSNQVILDSIRFIETKVEEPDGNPQGINTIYPNPSDGSINLRLGENITGSVQVKIFDGKGGRVDAAAEAQVISDTENGSILHLDGRGLPAGVYYISVSGEKGARTYKVIIKR